MKNFPVLMKRLFLLFLFIATIILQSRADNRGNYSFSNPIGELLRIPTGKTYTSRGLGTVGGISFENVAILNPGFTLQNLKIAYDASKPDGNRLNVTINGKAAKYEIFDWELIPVAKYANTPYNACFTYFGSLGDKNLETKILNNKGHILNYHPEFSNTLLGWRLADMDVLILYDFTTDLPKVNNKYILGGGEVAPNVVLNNTGAYNYYLYLTNIMNDLKDNFRSYVIGDYNQVISINVKNDSLKLGGYPYYYCWKFKYDKTGYVIQHVSDSISLRYSQILQQKKLENPNFNEKGFYIDSLISMSLKYPDSTPFYETGSTFLDVVSLSTREAKNTFLQKYATSDLKNMLVTTESYLDAYTAIYMKEFSDRMSGVPHMISAINPSVWHSTLITMQTSAFFRYVKKNYPDEWQTFMNQIAPIQPSPAVSTPTVMFETGNTAIEQALRDYHIVTAPFAEMKQEIFFYPNPVKDALTIENLSGKNLITISTVTGEIYTETPTAERQCTINTRHMTPGMYMLQITNNSRVIFTQKIIKASE
jgi:hypothetical protein